MSFPLAFILLQSSLQLFPSVHSCISSNTFQDHPLVSICLFTWCSHCVLCLPLGLSLVTFISSHLFGILCPSILLTCPNHPNLFISIWFCLSYNPRKSLMCAFLILSLLAFPIIALKNLNSFACILLSFSLCVSVTPLHIIISS
jgi:hypothetical protein